MGHWAQYCLAPKPVKRLNLLERDGIATANEDAEELYNAEAIAAPSRWLLDSSCTNLMGNKKSLFECYQLSIGKYGVHLERKNCTLVNVACALLADAHLDKMFWQEAIATAMHVQNHLATVALDGKTLEAFWIGSTPDVSHFWVFGCAAYAHTPDQLQKKLDPKKALQDPSFIAETQLVPLIPFMGDGPLLPLLQDPIPELPPEIPLGNPPLLDMLEPADAPPVEDRPPTPPPPCRCRGMLDLMPVLDHPWERRPSLKVRENAEADAAELDDICGLFYVGIPMTYDEAISGLEASSWMEAIVEEVSSIQVVHYKARLVVRGFHQVHGLDYDETFSPVVKMASLYTLFALAAARKWQVHHMDIKTTFLNGDLQEDIYMHILPGFEDDVALGGPIWQLRKALYGLK
ncbi:uncharacterized protein LOC112347549 [Selaginella moellendorffii]|uniref:uncharacterized protein LOC112347549 n=1 Tax=Selaginella moellendorffii TaxID=88036 RepID=UPI000D1D0DA2|nr:uncharacterized protein LOC112347549 [Selaginella moellendorffii]|eukprot:XP_024534394.1 uncharacterized protein LOC112347549 [Selaginella moellendorffii]